MSSAASLGSAIWAAVGLGVHTDFDAAVDAVVRPGEVLLPIQAYHQLYRSLEKEYRDVHDHTDAVDRRTYENLRLTRRLPGAPH
uniref:hypothetical protein n=1 Tax=Streptomyces polyasparticus TaxID=2767826 RepID=UPI001F16AA90|nr:hypothetical protein [Streptomyces polyasparticus]